jgi:hypothetical protein
LALKLAVGQMRVFEAQAATQWDQDTAQALLQLYPKHFAALRVNAEDVENFCRGQREYAAGFQITSKREVFKFIVLAVLLGAYFCHDPRFAVGMNYSIANQDFPQDRRMTLAGDFAEAWLGATWIGLGHQFLGARLARIIADRGHDCKTAHDISSALDGFVAQSPTIATADKRSRFLEACLSRADAFGFHDPHRRCGYAGLALMHGIFWFDDPLFVNLRRTFEQAISPDDLCARISAFYLGSA